MSTVYPDVNKYWINDTQLCWASACANALAWTGWNQAIAAARSVPALDEEGIYDIYRFECPMGIGDQRWEVIDAIDWILKYHQIRVPLLKVAQSRSTSDFFLARTILSRGGCVVLGVQTYGNINPADNYGHAITMYETLYGTGGNGENDPRRVESILFTDSDDDRQNRLAHQQHNIRLAKFDVSGKLIYFPYDSRAWLMDRWFSVLQNPSSI